MKEDFWARFMKARQSWELIGEGGFAKVFKSLDSTGRTVAIKEIVKERMRRKGLDWRRIVNESRIHLNLSHRNIVRLYDWADDGQCLYLAMEYCAFGDMSTFMKQRNAPLPERQAVHILSQVVEALDYMHKEHLVVHRDLSLANIFIYDIRADDMVFVKLGDFGLAAQLRTRNDKQMTLCGTVDTMPPEVIQKQPHGLEVDVWALGCILYTIMLGQSPFREEGDNIKEVFQRTLTGNKIKNLDQLSSDARHLLNGMIVRDPAHRFSLSSVRSHPLLTKYQKNENVSPYGGHTSVASADSGQGSLRGSALSAPRSSRSLDRGGRGYLRTSPSPPALRPPPYKNERGVRCIPNSKPPLPIGAGRNRFTPPMSTPPTYSSEPVRPAYAEETPPGPSWGDSRGCGERHSLRARDHHSVCSHSQYSESENACRKCGRNKSIERSRSRCTSYYESGSCGGRCQTRQPSPCPNECNENIQYPNENIQYPNENIQYPKSHAVSSLRSEMDRRFDSVTAKPSPTNENNCQIRLLPLSTIRLRPAVLKTKRGMFRVLESGDACMEFTKDKKGLVTVTEMMQVSGDGVRIVHFVPRTPIQLNEQCPLPLAASGTLQSYLLDDIPSRLHKHYSYVAAGCNLFRARTAKVTVYENDARYVLMEDSTFEMTNAEGVVVTLKSGAPKLKCLKEGHEITIANDLRDEFYRMLDHCRSIDRALTPMEQGATSPIYPLIVGSRRTSTGVTPRKAPSRVQNESPASTITPKQPSVSHKTPLSLSTQHNRMPSSNPVSLPTRIEKFACSVKQVSNGFSVLYDDGEIVEVEGSGVVHHTTANGTKKTYSIANKEQMPRRADIPLILEQWRSIAAHKY